MKHALLKIFESVMRLRRTLGRKTGCETVVKEQERGAACTNELPTVPRQRCASSWMGFVHALGCSQGVYGSSIISELSLGG